jgi:murein L,D-transpeptidase YafK
MVGLAQIRRNTLLAAAGLAVLTLAACSDYYGSIPKHLQPLSSATRALVEQKGMEQNSPILIRIFKEESVLEVWKKEKATTRYVLLKTYDICKWSGDLGPKKAEGDRQAPEGFYTITPAQMNPNSDYFLAFNLGYPNAYDQSLGRTGSHLMVHGACSSRGCYSMTDEQIQEIYTLARLAFQGGQRDFQVQAFPFRMTPENMAAHRNDPNMDFWRMLKEGYDHFEVIGQPPKVDVCSRRYVFNSVPQDGVTFSPTAECPPMSTPDAIRIRVAEKAKKDREEFQVAVARLEAREERGRERGWDAAAPDVMLAAGPTAISPDGAPMSVAAAPVPLEPATTASVGPAAPVAVAAAAAPPFLPAPDAAPAGLAAPPAASPEGTSVADRMQADSASAAPAGLAYVPMEPEKAGIGGFFSRVIDKVNPF